MNWLDMMEKRGVGYMQGYRVIPSRNTKTNPVKYYLELFNKYNTSKTNLHFNNTIAPGLLNCFLNFNNRLLQHFNTQIFIQCVCDHHIQGRSN